MTLIELFLFFFKISSVTFGGGIVILGIVQLEVEKRGGIGEEKFADMAALSEQLKLDQVASENYFSSLIEQ